MLRPFIAVLSFFVGLGIIAQVPSGSVRFVPSFKNDQLVLDEQLVLRDGTSVSVEQFRFYVSHITLYLRGTAVAIDSACHLIDAANEMSWSIPVTSTPSIGVDSINFMLGLDSATNASGVHGGDLDPTTGMYWTWNSGYINLKLEGTCATCATKGSEFQFHLGGFLPPHASAQWIGLSIPANGTLEFKVDLADLLARFDLGANCTLMSPGENAVELSRIAANCFQLR